MIDQATKLLAQLQRKGDDRADQLQKAIDSCNDAFDELRTIDFSKSLTITARAIIRNLQIAQNYLTRLIKSYKFDGQTD